MNAIPLPEVNETDQGVISAFLNRVFFQPLDFTAPGAVNAWPELFTRGYEILNRLAKENPDILPIEEMVGHCLNLTENSKLMYYTASVPVREMLEARARCAQTYFWPRMPGAVDWTPETKTKNGKRNKRVIDLAVYMKTWAPYTETFAALPFFLCLNRKKFRITVYTDHRNDAAMEQEFLQRGGEIVTLSGNLLEKLWRIRGGNHDILLITSNTSAIINEAFIFGLFRAARRQIVQFCQPYTTGLPAVDGFIAGSDLNVNPEDFSEKLLTVAGSGICFAQGTPEEPSAIDFRRAAFNIPENATVFVSGANYYKIRTELLNFWARLLAANPNAALVLFPFGPAWSNQYPAAQFMDRVQAAAVARGIPPERFIVCKPLPKRADIQRLIGLCDIYLDSFPYSGATSLLDPFSLHMPIIAMGTPTVCGGQGAGMLRECGLGDLVARDEEDYLRISMELAGNPARRKEITARMEKIMTGTALPPFHDLEAFARKVEPLYAEMMAE